MTAHLARRPPWAVARPPRCVLRGGGDLATGVAWRLSRLGCPIVVLELDDPMAVRRTVALATAVTDSTVDIEGMVGRRAETFDTVPAILDRREVAVVVSAELPAPEVLPRDVVVDARLAKRPGDTRRSDARRVVGLGPGFVAGEHCHAVVETMRGHRLGRVIWSGSAEADTGSPGLVGGRGAERVVRAPVDGTAEWVVAIGDVVEDGQLLGEVAGPDGSAELHAPFRGVVRGLIRSGRPVTRGLKIADVDPRSDPGVCLEISDKSLAVGGGVVEAVFAPT